MTSPDLTGPSVLPVQRHLFDMPDDVAFLNCAYMSPLPKASVLAGERGLRRKLNPWTLAPSDFFTGSEAVRALFAQLINAHADDIAFAPAVSYGMAQAAANIPLKATQTIVTLAEQFPSIHGWISRSARARASSPCRGPRTMIGRQPYSLLSIHRPASSRCPTVTGPTAGLSTL